MMNDDALRDAIRGLADRVHAEPGTLAAVRRAGHRIHRRHQVYAATGVAAVLAGTPITVHAVAAAGGSRGPVQVVGPASRSHHRTAACATPMPSPSPPSSHAPATAPATAYATPCRVTGVPSGVPSVKPTATPTAASTARSTAASARTPTATPTATPGNASTDPPSPAAGDATPTPSPSPPGS